MLSGRFLTASDTATSAPLAMVGSGRRGSGSGSGSGEEGSASAGILQQDGTHKIHGTVQIIVCTCIPKPILYR